MAPKKLQIAAAGLGRMGHRHALNFLNRTPRAQLVAAFSPDIKEHKWAREHLEPFGVTLYTDYDEMLKQEGLDAVVIGTATSVHAEEAIKAMQKNLHVLCEKPLSTSVDVCRQVVEEAKKRPHLKVMCGFSRRFDERYVQSIVYSALHILICASPATKVHTAKSSKVRSAGRLSCARKHATSMTLLASSWSTPPGLVASSWICLYDIDLTLWFFGNQILPKSISAHGCIAVQPGLAQHKDVDNAVGIVEFWGGQIAYYYCSRMMVSESLKPLWMYVLCKGSTVTDIVIARHTDKKTSPKLSAPKASSA
jgi:myo-inositol 2-dehydrogenase/D-chiro-inositol 1-dehydrogenase